MAMREELMLVDADSEDETHPTRLVTDYVKKSHAAGVSSPFQGAGHVTGTNSLNSGRSQHGGFEVIEDDSIGDDFVFLGKQTSSNFGDFIQPSSIFKRNFSNEGELSGRSRTQEQHDQNESGDEDGHLDGWIEDVMEAISDPFLIKKESTAIADLCKELNRPRLVINKQQIKEHYGYEIDGTTYLWAEEALYLIEIGKLELYVDEIAISVERARALLLHSQFTDPGQRSDADEPEILSCENDEYTVYKYFAKLGYRIRRRESLRYAKGQQEETTAAATSSTTNVKNLDTSHPIEEDDLYSCSTDSSVMDDYHLLNLDATTSSMPSQSRYGAAYEGQSPSARGTKRKAALGLISEDEEVSCEEDESDSIQSLCDDLAHGYSFVTGEPMEESGAVAGIIESQYTVAEAEDDDSDVEFVDEVIFSHSLVEIRELEASDPSIDDLENLPGTSASAQKRGPSPVILDLVSSSDSDCEEVTNESIWSNFTSVNSFEMKFPPGHLLPENIPARSDNKVYTYRTNQGDAAKTGVVDEGIEEMDVEKPVGADVDVDELKAAPTKSEKKEHERERKCDSWKDWRQLIMTEARDVLKESLLGARTVNNNDVTKKFNMWPPHSQNQPRHATSSSHCHSESQLRIPFDLFPVVNRNVSKHQLWTKIQPMFHVAVLRTTDPVLSTHDMEARLKAFSDNVPLMIALVDEDSQVLVLSSDCKPLPSLF